MALDHGFDSNISPVGSTDLDVLRKAQEQYQDSWKALVTSYGSMVYRLIRNSGIQSADAADITQQVLIEVVRNLGKFDRQQSGSFRRWLRVITRNKIIDFYRQQQDPTAGLTGVELPVTDPSSDSDLPQVSEEKLLLIDVMERVRASVNKNTWDAFEMMTAGMETSDEIGQKLGMSADAVRLAKRRVMIRIETLVRKEESNRREQGHSDPFSL
ncbi:MAG: hypothetical protein CMJ46_04240 [Planctomyces sp.]|nr:hypothetical protein [Planctomyces sp.]